MIIRKKIIRDGKELELLFFEDGTIGVLTDPNGSVYGYVWTEWEQKIVSRPPWRWFLSDERELEIIIRKALKDKTKTTYNPLVEKY